MKILLTGATGLIGKKLAARLSKAGHELVVLVRNPDAARAKLGADIEAHAWKAESGPPPSLALKGCEAVIHLAGEPVSDGRWTKARKQRLWKSRIVGSKNLFEGLQALGKHGPNVVVSASAVGIYGDGGDRELRETSPKGQGFLAGLTQAWEAETLLQTLPASRQVAMRIGVVLSTEGGALAKLLPVFRKFLGGRLGDGAQWMSWIHVDDLVDLFVRAIEDDRLTGAINAVAPYPVTNRDFTRALAKALRVPALMTIPAPVLRLLLGEMSTMLLHGQRVLPEKALAAGVAFRFPRIEEALRDLLAPK